MAKAKLYVCVTCQVFSRPRCEPICENCGAKLELLASAGRKKYHNRTTTVEGIRFDSKREATRWRELAVRVDVALVDRHEGRCFNVRPGLKGGLHDDPGACGRFCGAAARARLGEVVIARPELVVPQLVGPRAEWIAALLLRRYGDDAVGLWPDLDSAAGRAFSQ